MEKKVFINRYHTLNQKSQALHKQSNLFSLIRFVLCLFIIIDLLVGYFQHKEFLYVISFVSIIVFIGVVFYHHRIQNEYIMCKRKSEIYKKHIDRIEGYWDQGEDGSEFLDKDDLRSLDLDIFGHRSLYQFLNTCITDKGKQLFASHFKTNLLSREEICQRQQAVKELSNDEEFILDIETYGNYMQPIHQDVLLQFQNERKSFHCIFFIIPILTFISLFLAVFHILMPISYIICEIAIVLQIILAFICIKKHQELFFPIQSLSHSLNGYYHIFQMIEEKDFQSPYLQEIQKNLINHKKATQGIKQLSHIAQAVAYRKNIFVFILFNALFSYDMICECFYKKWLNDYGQYLNEWLESLAQFEVCMSLSVVKIDDFDVSIPQIQDHMSLSFKNLRHPLINQTHVVGNDWYLERNMNIITGSNMSGKTTFMRSVALNLILAYMGGYVFASEMKCSHMTILTSMRVKDDVGEGISTFYGELLRIKKMIEETSSSQPMICFIDEIFKGTNSLDRIAGAKATIKELSLPYCLTFITTHDFELCELNENHLMNYHFDEYYQDNHIYFDYLIHKGKSQSTNGQFLLKQLGIIKDEEDNDARKNNA